MLPTLVDYYQGLNGAIIAAMCVGAALTITTIAIFFAKLPSVLKTVPKQFKSKTIYLLAIYQVRMGVQWVLIENSNSLIALVD